MNGKTAALLFVVVCLSLSVLSLAGIIAPLVAGGVFAAALVFFGGFSLAFRRIKRMTEEQDEEQAEEREVEQEVEREPEEISQQ